MQNENQNRNYSPLLLASLPLSVGLSWIGLVSDFWRWLEPEPHTEPLQSGAGAFVAALMFGILAILIHLILHGLLFPLVASKKYNLPLPGELVTQRKAYTLSCLGAALLGAVSVGFWTELPLFATLPLAGNVCVYAFFLTLIGARTRRTISRLG